MISEKAIEEFNKISTSVCDRTVSAFNVSERVSPKAFTVLRTGKMWKKRREAFVKSMELNYVSKKIPMIMQCLEEKFEKTQIGDELNFSDLMKEVTFRVIFTILFGPDLFKYVGKVNYELADGTIEPKSVPTAMSHLFLDHLALFSNTMFLLSPRFSDFCNISLIKRNSRNREEVYKVIQDFLDKKVDEDSVYHKVLHHHKIPAEEALQDTIFFLAAGLDTTAAGVSATIYLLHKYPETLKKLRAELFNSGITKDSDFSSPEVQDSITN